MMQFHSPWWGLMAVPLTILLIFNLRRRPPALQMPSLKPFAAAGKSRNSVWLTIPKWLYYLGFLCLTVGMMRPQMGISHMRRRASGIDIILALDASGSMAAYDVPDDVSSMRELVRGIQSGKIANRMDIAKAALERFVARRGNDRIGLIAFASLPFVASPPTLNHDFVTGHLELLEPGELGGYTGIAGPVGSATNKLKDSPAKRRVVVLFTDGANNINDIVTPEQAASIAKEFDITIYTVGIGSDNAFLRRAETNSLVRMPREYNRELMTSISKITGGKYFEADDTASFNAVMQEIDALETVEQETPIYADYRELFMVWLLAGVACVTLAFCLENSLLQLLP